METLRKKAIDCFEEARESGNEKAFLTGSLAILLADLKGISGKQSYEVKNKIRSLLEKACCFLMAGLVALRSGQKMEDINGIEEAFKEKKEEVQIKFLNRVLEPLCLMANRDAIEIAAYFLRADENKVVVCAREVLTKAGKKPNAKNIVTEVLEGHLSQEEGALGVLAGVSSESAIAFAIDQVKHGDENVRQEALLVLAKTALSKEVCEKMVKHLKSAGSKVLWEDSDHRVVLYGFVAHAFTEGMLLPEDAKALITKAFQNEEHNLGLGKLLPVVKAIFPQDEQLLFDGFLAMEGSKKKDFYLREGSVGKFIATLNAEKLVEYLQASLLASDDETFAWFAGQHLIATDVDVAVETFVQCAKAGEPKRKISTLAQLAMKVCDDKESRSEWKAPELNKTPKSRFAPVTQALLAFAEMDKCPSHVRLWIAFQPGIFGGSVECCRKANSLLERVILDERSSSAQVLEALQALLNCQAQKKVLGKDIDAILQKAYVSEHKERLLEQLLEIMINDIRGYPQEPLFYSIVEFIKNIESTEAIPMLQKALHAKLPDADLGSGARWLYVSALKKFALKGSLEAVSIIAEYRKGNINSEAVPQALAEIYRQSSSAKIKKAVVKGVADRFIYSISEETDTKVFYLYELEAVKALKREMLVQKAFLKGVVAIGDIHPSRRSRGMSGIIENIPVIMPKEKEVGTREALKKLSGKLSAAKQRLIAGRGWIDNKEDVATIDSILTEVGMLMAGM